jgi:hypothetical protein
MIRMFGEPGRAIVAKKLDTNSSAAISAASMARRKSSTTDHFTPSALKSGAPTY